ncbi:metallophosphoesterase [Flavobacteriaceae bacterium KMM 6897]|nr:metallophosphoesterase [Flavobacteriaceae bacterium KMM 6897]MEB8346768.1 metallophosphoesterase [Flavobacteriaceae bacterium KMM 6898]
MQGKISKYLKRIFLLLLIAIPVILLIGYSMDARVHYADNPLALNWNNDGPYVFFENDSILSINYIKGNSTDGFFLEQKNTPVDSFKYAKCYYPIDSTSFDFPIKTDFETPKSTYSDTNKILAISDIEGNFKTFRNFLINNQVIDDNLNWTFGNGHLVLIGDFIDRGYFDTQVLWFIYKLEYEAKKLGGYVHYILGNHELKMMQGNYYATDPKYSDIAAILEKKQIELYDSNSLIGNWLASKNALELINGNLFVHGGIHPDLAHSKLSIEEINQIIRLHYYRPFEAAKNEKQIEFLISTSTGPCWYRGYFKDGLSQEQIDSTLERFNAKSVIVGHTIQSKVNSRYNRKVIGIDVQHPNDDHKLWPEGKSEALFIDGKIYYRIFNNGDKKEI